jgi:hypothetical protein
VKEKEGDIKGRGARGAEDRGNVASICPQGERHKNERGPTKMRGQTKMVATKMMAILFVWPVFVCPNL